ncbi:hypothetical protein pdam_00021645, partial [Pocillopora damicornis]
DGVGRSGCVATIMSVIERVKIEQTVDVFQTIKLIRAKRPGAVNTLLKSFFYFIKVDTARVMLRSSEPDKDYINASFVDNRLSLSYLLLCVLYNNFLNGDIFYYLHQDYSRRDAYILTQAPLNDTVNDFWRMISQYDIGTIVMLNSLKEEKEVYFTRSNTKRRF